MDSEYKPSESDIKTVMEAHDLLPEGQQAESGDSAPSMGSVLFDLMGNTPRKGGRKE